MKKKLELTWIGKESRPKLEPYGLGAGHPADKKASATLAIPAGGAALS